MAEMSESVKQIRASVMVAAKASSNQAAYLRNWNSLIDQAIVSVTAAQGAASLQLSLDNKAYDLLKQDKAAAETDLATVDESYDSLAGALAGTSSGGHDILSVLSNYSSMRNGPYCATVVLDNYYAKMAHNIEVMNREILSREKDLETLSQLKVS